MEGGRMVDGTKPSVMASLTEVRAVSRILEIMTEDFCIAPGTSLKKNTRYKCQLGKISQIRNVSRN